MAAPMKPWEAAGARMRSADEPDRLSSGFVPAPLGYPGPQTSMGGMGAIGGLGAPAPPALPPRPLASQNYSMNGAGYSPYGSYGSYGSFGGGYGGYGGMGMGYGGYGSYGGYGGYGGMGGMGGMGGFHNRLGGNMYGDVESRFIQLAEESSRPTFQSIESVVGAVGSVAMMLENTFFAMTSSFRAILGVAENFGRLRSLFAQFWSAFAVFRGFNWLIKKLLVMLGIRTQDEFRAWADAQKACAAESSGHAPKPPRTSSWPAVLFLAIIGAVPYIIVKMLSTINNTIQGNLLDPSTWKDSMQAIAQYDFQASSPQEVGFRAHQILTIAPQCVQGNLWNSGWLMASADGKNAGLVPINYFKIIRDPTMPLIQNPPPAIQNAAPSIQSAEPSIQNATPVVQAEHTKFSNEIPPETHQDLSSLVENDVEQSTTH